MGEPSYTFGSDDPPQWTYTTAPAAAPHASAAAAGIDQDVDGTGWSRWLGWDPDASKAFDTKFDGAVRASEAEQSTAGLLDHRPNPEPQTFVDPRSMPPTSHMTTASVQAPFAFGADRGQPPMFGFEAEALHSPSPGHARHQAEFFPAEVWPAHPNNGMPSFSAVNYDSTAVPVHHVPAKSSTSSLLASRSRSASARNRVHTSPPSTPSSPEHVTGNARKRKSSSSATDAGSASKQDDGQPPKKTAHNMIEKRYRNNLNDKIAALRDSVPSLRIMSRGNGAGEEEDDPEDLEGLTPAHKLNKATVLAKATEYIRHLEKRIKRLQDENASLQTRVEGYERMSLSAPLGMHTQVSTPDSSRYADDPFGASHALGMGAAPQGMIRVPDHIANLRQGIPPQAHYAPAYPPHAGASRFAPRGPMIANSRGGSGMMGKLMVGSLAGLMVIEGLVDREQSTTHAPAKRGLAAVPVNFAAILAPRVSLGASSAHIPLAKLILVVGAVFFIVAPLLTPKPREKSRAAHAANLARAPSLASPMEVRHRAWLTAIQTVWVPRHNILLEVGALTLKALKLSTRKLIGWSGYAFLTGTTEEQEAARVKAWCIALDAQLTGGDAEISKSRLVLTLLASGTLPDTPGQLMLKALHIRILLWELANVGHGLSSLFDCLSAKLARRYWDMARSEQRIAANRPHDAHADAALPAHLVALLDKECDEVLVPCIVQRAHNLAWDRPIADKTALDPSMDGVVEDVAISSPLDALAAWYSSCALRDALHVHLTDGAETSSHEVISTLELATSTAPPNSQAHLRSLVAQAIVVDAEEQSVRLAAAVRALPAPSAPPSHGALLATLVEHAPVATDVRLALTLIKCHTLLHSSTTTTISPTSRSDSRAQALFVVNTLRVPDASLSLLSFAAAYTSLVRFMRPSQADALLRTDMQIGLEHLAASLRVWVGREAGRRRAGLGQSVRERIVGRCVEASRVLVGIVEPVVAEGDGDGDGGPKPEDGSEGIEEEDQGYVSAGGSVREGSSIRVGA